MIEVAEEHIPVLSSTFLIHFTFLSLGEEHSKGKTGRSNKSLQKGKGIHMKLFSQVREGQASNFMNEYTIMKGFCRCPQIKFEIVMVYGSAMTTTVRQQLGHWHENMKYL